MREGILQPAPGTLDEDGFVAAFGDAYEHSPWVARRAWRAGLPGDDLESVAGAMADVVRNAEVEEQLALIRAHPDLAGRAAVAGELTGASSREQRGAGLDRCTPEEYERFQRYNAAYWARFGFPFVIAVAGLDRRDILAAFEARLANDVETERCTALEQINRIARLRLRGRVAGG